MAYVRFKCLKPKLTSGPVIMGRAQPSVFRDFTAVRGRDDADREMHGLPRIAILPVHLYIFSIFFQCFCF